MGISHKLGNQNKVILVHSPRNEIHFCIYDLTIFEQIFLNLFHFKLKVHNSTSFGAYKIRTKIQSFYVNFFYLYNSFG